MANQAGIKTGFDAGRRAAIFRTSQPLVNPLITEGEILLGAAVVIGGLAAHAKDNISRKKVLRYAVAGTLAALGLGGCNDQQPAPPSNGGTLPTEQNSGCGSGCAP